MNRFQIQSKKEKNRNTISSFELNTRNIEKLTNDIKNLLIEHSFSSSTIYIRNPTIYGDHYDDYIDYLTIIVTFNKLAYKNDFVDLFEITITEADVICDSLFETIKQKMDKEIFNLEEIHENETYEQRLKRLRMQRPPPTPMPSIYK